jgi:hypothetical protein
VASGSRRGDGRAVARGVGPLDLHRAPARAGRVGATRPRTGPSSPAEARRRPARAAGSRSIISSRVSVSSGRVKTTRRFQKGGAGRGRAATGRRASRGGREVHPLEARHVPQRARHGVALGVDALDLHDAHEPLVGGVALGTGHGEEHLARRGQPLQVEGPRRAISQPSRRGPGGGRAETSSAKAPSLALRVKVRLKRPSSALPQVTDTRRTPSAAPSSASAVVSKPSSHGASGSATKHVHLRAAPSGAMGERVACRSAARGAVDSRRGRRPPARDVHRRVARRRGSRAAPGCIRRTSRSSSVARGLRRAERGRGAPARAGPPAAARRARRDGGRRARRRRLPAATRRAKAAPAARVSSRRLGALPRAVAELVEGTVKAASERARSRLHHHAPRRPPGARAGRSARPPWRRRGRRAGPR